MEIKQTLNHERTQFCYLPHRQSGKFMFQVPKNLVESLDTLLKFLISSFSYHYMSPHSSPSPGVCPVAPSLPPQCSQGLAYVGGVRTGAVSPMQATDEVTYGPFALSLVGGQRAHEFGYLICQWLDSRRAGACAIGGLTSLVLAVLSFCLGL